MQMISAYLFAAKKAGKRVNKTVYSYLTSKLKLKVNEQKSPVCKNSETKLLGNTILDSDVVTVANQSVVRLKQKIRKLTQRNRGMKF